MAHTAQNPITAATTPGPTSPSFGSPFGASMSLPSARGKLRGDSWRRKYLSTLGMGSPAARQQPPKVSTGPKTSPILLNTEEPHSSHSHAHSRTVVVPPRRPPSVAASGAAPGPSAGSPGSSAGAPIDEDDFMYLDDDVFGWNNELESDVGAGGGSDEGASRGASRHARVVLPRRVYDASDCSLPANTFVPPHRLVSHDCFSLGVRREFRAAKAPM